MAVGDRTHTWQLGRQRVLPFTFACGSFIGLISSGVVASFLFYRGYLRRCSVFALKTCASADCLYVAETIRASVNVSVDPCHDFYDFVCGSYSEALPDQINSLSYRTRSIFEALLDAGLKNKTAAVASSAASKANALYRSCLDVVAKKQADLPVLTTFLADEGLDLRAVDGSALEKIFRLYFQYGITAVFAFNLAEFASKDYKRQLLLRVDKALLVWYKYREALMKTGVIEGYMRVFLAPYSDQLEKIMTLVFRTENKAHIAMKRIASVQKGNFSEFYSVQISDIGQFTPNVVTASEWTRLVLKYAGSLYTTDDRILVEELAMNYLRTLYATVGSRGITLLVAWNVLRTYSGYADSSVASFVYGDYKSECLTRLDRIMPVAFHAQQLFTVAPPDVARAAHQIAINVKKGTDKLLVASSWLDSSSKRVALRKLSRMELHVGYPEGQDTLAALDAYYDDLAYPSGPFLAAWLNASSHYMRKLLGTSVDAQFPASEVNAFYQLGANRIIVPAAFLQAPIFMPRGPAAFNYGSFGHVVGHEIMHAYDVHGITVNEHGSMGATWVHPLSLARYKDHVRCVREEHEKVLTWRSLVLTDDLDSENLADLVGARSAFDAYRSLDGADRFVRVPGQFYPNQLFFIGFCLKWCEQRGYSSAGTRYAPGYARCVVPLRNMREFADAFNCKSHARMNPERKCSFW